MDSVQELPGIAKIKLRFLSLLDERLQLIAHHAVAAWQSTEINEQRLNLETAQNALHQIAGSAGSLGMAQLGQSARDCETEILDHLETGTTDTHAMPADILHRVDEFVNLSTDLIKKGV